MAPPQVNLNEKPASEQSFEDPLPEKKATQWEDVAVAVEGQHMTNLHQSAAAAIRRRQQKRCRLACCVSLSFILILMMALGTACLVYRLKHRKHWRSYCTGQRGDRIPEHVDVDHENRLITVRPEHESHEAMEVMHEYNRRLIAFKNSTEKVCYIDRLDETFEDGYARWQAYEEHEHKPSRHLRVVPTPIDIEVVQHIAGIHIYAHCGEQQVEYYWVVMATEIEVSQNPQNKYIQV